MTTLQSVADWVYSLNPWQLTALTVAVTGCVMGAVLWVSWLWTVAASGGGEANEGEAEGDK